MVKKFKFEEPRIEQIQDLEVCICTEYWLIISCLFPGHWFYLNIFICILCRMI